MTAGSGEREDMIAERREFLEWRHVWIEATCRELDQAVREGPGPGGKACMAVKGEVSVQVDIWVGIWERQEWVGERAGNSSIAVTEGMR